MAAYEIFAAGTVDAFIQNIKNKAEAYGWAVDRFGATWYGHNRLHLHNADGAHFELFYQSPAMITIIACTGYNSAVDPSGQPGASGSCTFLGNGSHLIAVGEHSIFIKATLPSLFQNIQFGCVVDKIGSWSGGIFISSTYGDSNYSFSLWGSYLTFASQLYINGAWSTLNSSAGGGVYGVYATAMMGKMPFAYCGGILPCRLLLVQINATTTTYRHPLGYAPDILCFSGGDVYASLEEMVYDGSTWVGINQYETGGTFKASPDLLIRLAA